LIRRSYGWGQDFGKGLQSKINSDGGVAIGLRLIHDIHREGNEPATAVFLNPTPLDLPFESERFGHVYHAKFRNVNFVAIAVELVIGKANPPDLFFLERMKGKRNFFKAVKLRFSNTEGACKALHRKQITLDLAQAEMISLKHVADSLGCPIDLPCYLFDRSLHKSLANDFKLGLGPSSMVLLSFDSLLDDEAPTGFGRPL
jgi:hypothetical protein